MRANIFTGFQAGSLTLSLSQSLTTLGIAYPAIVCCQSSANDGAMKLQVSRRFYKAVSKFQSCGSSVTMISDGKFPTTSALNRIYDRFKNPTFFPSRYFKEHLTFTSAILFTFYRMSNTLVNEHAHGLVAS